MKHFIYSRKSSEDEDRQALSIAAQLSELNTIAFANNLSIVEIFSESKSAKEPGREVFNEMLRRIEGSEANAILTWKLDRLARNFEDGGKLIGLLQRGVIQEIRTFEKTYLPSDNVLTIAVELGMANQYVRDLSVNIRRGIREKVRRGIFCSKAPLGYFNHPTLRTIEPHKKTFPKLKAVLEEFAKGDQELADVQRALTRAGLVGQRNGKPLAFATIGDLLRNPFYYGAFAHKGEVHQGIHEPMISKKTFDTIQEVLLDIGKPRNGFRKQKGFLFLNFVTCASCGCAITAERHIKRSGLKFHYYRCTYKNKKHPCNDRTYTRQEVFEAEVKRNVDLAALPDEWKEKFLTRVENWSEELQDKKQVEIERLKDKLSDIKTKLQRINNAFAEGTLDVDEFKELKNPIVPQKMEIEQNLVALQTSRADRLEPLRNWILEANTANQMVFENNLLKMKPFLRKIGSNRLLHAQTLRVSFKKPWDFLAETNLAVRSTNSVSEQTSLWWRRGELNPCPRRFPRKHLHVYPASMSEELTLHRRTANSRASAISILRIRRGRSADSPACCPRFRRQQASLRKRHGQLSRESEIFVICVYLFWSGF
jgi:site-specific DNA recombinase